MARRSHTNTVTMALFENPRDRLRQVRRQTTQPRRDDSSRPHAVDGSAAEPAGAQVQVASEHPPPARHTRAAALLVVLAGLAFSLPAVLSDLPGQHLFLLAAGCCLLLSGLFILDPLLAPSVRESIDMKHGLIVALSAACGYLLATMPLVDAARIAGMVVIVAAAGLGLPAEIFTPLTAAAAGLLGYAAGSHWQVAPVPVLAATVATAALLSLAAFRIRSTQNAYARARTELETNLELARSRSAPSETENATAATILTAARSFVGALDPAEIVAQVAGGMARSIRADAAILLIWDDTQRTLRIGALKPGAGELRQVEVPTHGVPTLRDHPPGQVVTLPTQAFREPILRSLLKRWRLTTILGVRLQQGERLLGVAFLGRSGDHGPFSAADRKVLSGIAVHAVASLGHANLISELQAANQLKEEFMATMSHELRTPLNVIIGYTDLQLDDAFGALEEEHRDAVERTRGQAVQLLDLIQATLDMSRIERGLVSVELGDVILADFLEELRREIPTTWRKPTVELNWHSVRGIPPIRTDPNKLRIILRNLVHNALKFTQHGIVNVSVSSRAATEQVTFVIQDTGVGIKAEHLSKIFEMFRQIPQQDSVPGGVGLGLYIVRRLAEVLGAEIEVSSAPGRGTTFRVHLPVGGPLAALKRSTPVLD